jgi:hypothetical protein
VAFGPSEGLPQCHDSWSGWRESNTRSPLPESGAIPLRHNQVSLTDKRNDLRPSLESGLLPRHMGAPATPRAIPFVIMPTVPTVRAFRSITRPFVHCAPQEGFEPPSQQSECRVLPLHHRGMIPDLTRRPRWILLDNSTVVPDTVVPTEGLQPHEVPVLTDLFVILHGSTVVRSALAMVDTSRDGGCCPHCPSLPKRVLS